MATGNDRLTVPNSANTQQKIGRGSKTRDASSAGIAHTLTACCRCRQVRVRLFAHPICVCNDEELLNIVPNASRSWTSNLFSDLVQRMTNSVTAQNQMRCRSSSL